MKSLSTLTASILIAIGASATSISVRADEQYNFCMNAYPDEIQARIELRDRFKRALLRGNDSSLTLHSVVSLTRRWLPSQTVKVAFNPGDAELHGKIARVASEWAKHANVVLDFGYSEDTRTYRTWSDNDTQFAADIRVNFYEPGYWSLVGTDSSNPSVIKPSEPSLSLSAFHIELPADWESVVLHEFGHALGFEHEHQHPFEGCDSEFRWSDDLGYVPTKDQYGQFVVDANGRRPGLYTVLAGPPNNWTKAKVDHNLRQLDQSHAYLVTEFDPNSIMKYAFPQWMFVSNDSYCYTPFDNHALSQGDIEGARMAYPRGIADIRTVLRNSSAVFTNAMMQPSMDPKDKQKYAEQLRQIDNISNANEQLQDLP